MPARSSDLWHHALMDLGATICAPRAPRCEICPLNADCRFAHGSAGKAAAGGRHQDRSHDARPAAFRDTDRRIRGAIVKALTVRDMTVGALEKEIGDDRVGRLTEALVADGLVERVGGRYRLPL
jgi:A/G-specific adenine glycosylase